ncbi:hypothetical protein D1007_11449 [Hordeum vulgare]|nr:hypothetical protein D1007_11449 [Hordeum vulgare]
MEASQPADLVNVKVAHAQSRPVDLVADHVVPAVAQATNVPARKRQGNVSVQGSIPAGLAGREGALGAAVAARSSWLPTWKMSKVSGMKRKKVRTKKPSSTPSASARCTPTVPFYSAASTADEVFDGRDGRSGRTYEPARPDPTVIREAGYYGMPIANERPGRMMQRDLAPCISYVDGWEMGGAQTLHDLQ